MNPHPSLTRLNSRQVQTAPQFPAVLASHALLRPPPPGFTWPPAPRHMGFTCPASLLPRHLGSHALLRPATWVHMPSCPPPPRHLGSHALLRPATWVSHALLRPGLTTWGSHALLPSSAPPGFTCPPALLGFTCPPAPRHLGFTCPPPRGSHALLPSSAPPGFTCRPGVHMPSCPPPPRHLGSHAVLRPWGSHALLGFTCPPALLRPATWGSHALLRPAWVSHAPALLRPATWGSHALLRPACYTPLLHLMPQPPATFHEAFLPERKFPSLKPDDRGPRNPPPPTRSVDECFFGKL